MDLADQAQQQNELAEAYDLDRIRLLLQAAPQPTGRCLWCGDLVPPGVRFCNRDCLDDWQHATDRALAMGRTQP